MKNASNAPSAPGRAPAAAVKQEQGAAPAPIKKRSPVGTKAHWREKAVDLSREIHLLEDERRRAIKKAAQWAKAAKEIPQEPDFEHVVSI
ncbi:hypothetical protein C2857_004881 [Epichloe festucae Fl1]|uniref:Uncharacterized protein n=1 Tax=Epichloe festucae (strain Fl1) TaxID=877507 RepID=A0A7S9PSI5_EPIFF|nr:hypothetical protein C2857_004881 [Epichloe festucae Fl1]